MKFGDDPHSQKIYIHVLLRNHLSLDCGGAGLVYCWGCICPCNGWWKHHREESRNCLFSWTTSGKMNFLFRVSYKKYFDILLWWGTNRKIALFRMINSCASLNWYSGTGPQPELFLGRGGFIEIRALDKHFIKKSRKEAPQGNILEFFSLRYS